VLNDSSHRDKEIGTKLDKGQKFSASYCFAPSWQRAVLGVSLLGKGVRFIMHLLTYIFCF